MILSTDHISTAYCAEKHSGARRTCQIRTSRTVRKRSGARSTSKSDIELTIHRVLCGEAQRREATCQIRTSPPRTVRRSAAARGAPAKSRTSSTAYCASWRRRRTCQIGTSACSRCACVRRRREAWAIARSWVRPRKPLDEHARGGECVELRLEAEGSHDLAHLRHLMMIERAHIYVYVKCVAMEQTEQRESRVRDGEGTRCGKL